MDHPRMCGKKIALVRSAKGWWGSPPHVREKERDEIKDVGGFGITPACAGKSRLPHDLDWYVRDHPRMCGKKIALVRSAKGWWGSPPHVREKVEPVDRSHDLTGITPACAGKRNELGNGLSLMQDHPRMCGKKSALSIKGRRWVGSPPHVREKGLIHFKSDLFIRITPACAGKRSVCWWC